ncbi:hypothetical protein, partial [Actinospica sp.]|uniref:hypothetical protein n=1 Tax=Actinospica sp. TaxID=1872142 RepID=UPI002D145BD5
SNLELESAVTTDETTPNYYAPGPLNPDELADVLRTAYALLREDKDHDVFTLLDVLAADRYPGMDRDASYQVARAVLKFLVGIGASETREPILALHLWHRRNLDPGSSIVPLEWALAGTVRQFDGDPLFRRIEASSTARQDGARGPTG